MGFEGVVFGLGCGGCAELWVNAGNDGWLQSYARNTDHVYPELRTVNKSFCFWGGS